MVKTESYDFTPANPKRVTAAGDIKNLRTSFPIERLERAAHGAWFLTVFVDVVAELEDGRIVTIKKRVRLKGSQEGKRPNPNPFGRNTKRKKAGKSMSMNGESNESLPGELAVTEIGLKRKLLFCSATLRRVRDDLGFMSLDEKTRQMVEEARTPIGGWEAGLKRIRHFLELDDAQEGE